MKIKPKLMTDAELADFVLTVERAFTEQSLAGLEMNYDALANAGPSVLGHIAALTAERDTMADFARIACDDRDAHAARCVELQRQSTTMEMERDSCRAALARHEERVVEQTATWLERFDDRDTAWLSAQLRNGAWRKDPT